MNRQFFVTVLAAAGLAWGGVMARGEELARWNSANVDTAAGSYAAVQHAEGVSAGALAVGPGLTKGGTTAKNVFAAYGFSSTGYSAAEAAGDYWEVSLAPQNGLLALETLEFSFGGPVSGPKACQWAYRVGASGSFTALGAPIDLTKTKTGYYPYSVDISEVPASDSTVYFRLVGWNGATANTACGSFGQNTNVLVFSGTVQSLDGPPVVRFTPAGGSVDAGKTLEMAVAVLPAGSGVSAWSVTPTPAGVCSLSGGKFRFTPAAEDAQQVRFTLSVTATNRYGTTTGTASVLVNEAAPEGTLTLTFDNERQTSWSGAGSVEIPAGGGLAWKMENCMIGEDEEQDKVYGGAGKALRFAYDEPGAFQSQGKIVAVSKGTETVQTNGVAEVRFWYGIYGEDAGEESEHPVRPTLVTELSDDGKLWVEVDRVATEGSESELQKREIEVGVETPVYFRIRVEGVAGSSRVNVDQVRIVPKVTDRDQRVLFLLQHNVTPGDAKTGIEPTSKDDWDGDGKTNFQEFQAKPKTNPYDRNSK